MPAKKTANKGGRPKVVWDGKKVDMFQSLCRIHCTEDEICSVMGIDAETLVRIINDQMYESVTGNRRTESSPKIGFSDAYKKYSAEGRTPLRRAQWRNAIENNNVTMQIWLGKQELGQKDQVVETVAEVPKFYFDPNEAKA